MEEELRVFLGVASPSIKMVCSLLCMVIHPMKIL